MNYSDDKTSFAESLCSWLMGQDKTEASMASVEHTMHVRQKIIETLESIGLTDHAPLMFKVVNAPGLSGLWYLRPEIMQALSKRLGEANAHGVMAGVNTLFAGKLPESRYSRVHAIA
jgi:hypothetical protein